METLLGAQLKEQINLRGDFDQGNSRETSEQLPNKTLDVATYTVLDEDC